jgi:hypothetical protein
VALIYHHFAEQADEDTLDELLTSNWLLLAHVVRISKAKRTITQILLKSKMLTGGIPSQLSMLTNIRLSKIS